MSGTDTLVTYYLPVADFAALAFLQRVHIRLKEEGKDYESKRKELQSSRSYKRTLRLVQRSALQ